MLSKHSLHPIPLAPAWTAVMVMVSTTRTQSAKRPAAKRPAKGPASKRPAKKRPAAKRPTKGPAAKRPAKRPAKGPVAKRRPSKLSALGGPLLTESDGSGSDSDRSGGDSDPSVHRSDSSCLSKNDADLPHGWPVIETADCAIFCHCAYCAFCGHKWTTSARHVNLFCHMDGQGPLCANCRHRCRNVAVSQRAMLLCPDCARTLCHCDERAPQWRTARDAPPQ